MIDRKYIKGAARSMVRGRWFRLLAGFIPSIAVAIVTSILTSLITRADYTAGAVMGYIISLLTGFLGAFYCCAYFIRFVRTSDCRLNGLFKAIRNGKHFLQIFLANLVTGILVSIGICLLVIPGIICACWFSQTHFVLADSPDLTFIQAMKVSRKIMKGRCFEYIVLLLSFLGWIFVGIFTLGILYLWLVPYMQSTLAIFYHEACSIAVEDARTGDYFDTYDSGRY